VKKFVTFSVAFFGVLYGLYLGLLYFSQGSMLYPGAATRGHRVLAPTAGVEVIRVPIEGGTVEALFQPATRADGSPQPVVIFAHGNGELTDDWIHKLDGFRDRGVGVLLAEFPGYGRSGGTPSEQSIRAAMVAFYDRLVADPRVDRSRIVGFGESLGGGAIGVLAKERPLRALILMSTFTSLDVFAAGYGAPTWLMRDHFDTLSTVRQFKGPVLVIHGTHDTLIPWQQGQRLAQASPHGLFKRYECGHPCWDLVKTPFWTDVEPFMERAGIW
jgi:pimeloyl-ACP methyl ester carboxylesterase